MLVVALTAATGGGKPSRRFDSRIRLRESFRPELLKSADAL